MKAQLLHGDCLEKMKEIPDKSIDMILCDLPYGTTACKWDVIIPFEPLWIQYKRIIKDRGCIALFGSEPFSSYLRMSNIKQYKYDWVWNKVLVSGHLNAKKMPMNDYEIISIFGKGKIRYFPRKEIGNKQHGRGNVNLNIEVKGNKGTYGSYKYSVDGKGNELKYPKRIITFRKPHPSKCLHSNEKPIELLEYLIKTYTLEGEVVLDNCMGSFSTAIACLNTKRNFIGIEKDAHYFQVGKDRLEKHLLVLDYTPEIIYNQV